MKLLEAHTIYYMSYTQLSFLRLFLLVNSYLFVILTTYCEIFDGFVQPVFPRKISKMRIYFVQLNATIPSVNAKTPNLINTRISKENRLR